MKAKGRLVHHFHGNYWFQLVLIFETEDQAIETLSKFPSVLDFAKASTAKSLFTFGDKDKLEEVKAFLEPLRIDSVCELLDCKRKAKKLKVRHPIDATSHSVDYGPEFTVEL